MVVYTGVMGAVVILTILRSPSHRPSLAVGCMAADIALISVVAPLGMPIGHLIANDSCVDAESGSLDPPLVAKST